MAQLNEMKDRNEQKRSTKINESNESMRVRCVFSTSQILKSSDEFMLWNNGTRIIFKLMNSDEISKWHKLYFNHLLPRFISYSPVSLMFSLFFSLSTRMLCGKRWIKPNSNYNIYRHWASETSKPIWNE